MAYGLRTALVYLLLAVGGVAVPLAAVAWWEERTVSDADEFVATLAPLADDQEVQDLVADEVVEQVMAPVESRLPAALTDGVRETVESTVRDVVESEEFAVAWERALRDLHPEVVAVLAGEDGDAITVDDTTVALRLDTLSDPVREALDEAGVPGTELLPDLDITVPVATVEHLRAGQATYAVVHDRFLPALVAGVVLLLAGVAIAPDHRRAAVTGAVLTLGALVATLLALIGGRGLAADRMPPDARGAGSEAMRLLTEPLQTSLAVLATLALVAVIVLVLVRLATRRLESPAPGATDAAATIPR